MKPGWSMFLKKMTLLALALSLIVPQAALAQDGESVPIWQFNDMADTHWATKHVRKIGLLGITSGDNQGNYNPTNNITRQEAVMMAINLLGWQEEAKANTVAVNLGFHVAPWAEVSVKYAAVKGLINLKEESALATLNPETLQAEWGTVEASREWIAKLIVRALGKDGEAKERDGEYTGFADDGAISDGYAGYVQVVKDLGIMVGDNANRFNPTASITRAEMAVVFGQAEQHLAARHRQVVLGTLDSVSPSSISVRTQAGLAAYPLAENAVFYTHEHNNPIVRSSLTLGDAIFLIQYGGTAYYVEKTAQIVRYETIRGEFENIYTDSSQIAVWVDGELKLYPFTPGVTTFTAESGKGILMSDLTPGSEVELIRPAGSTVITGVVEKRKVELRTIAAVVEKIFADSRIIEYRDAATGEKQLVEIPADAAIRFGSRTVELADLHVGDEISLSLKDGKVEAVDVIQSAVTLLEGKVRGVDAPGRMILLEGVDTPVVGYYTENNVIVSIAGLSAPRLSDVQAGDEVVLELNAHNRIQKITVLNRSIDAHMGLKFVMFHDDSNTLIYEDQNKHPGVKVLTADTVILNQYNVPVPLDQINQHFREGDKIDLIFTGERLVRMSYSKSYTGVIKNISPRTNTITLEADDFGEVTFPYTMTPFVLMFGKQSASLSDVLIGNRVKLELDSSQSRVQYLSLIQQLLFKVKNKQSHKLVVTDSAGHSYDITSPNAATFTHHEKLFASYADVETGGYVMVTFTGTQATDIHIPRVAYGIVQSVDLAQNAFTFAEYGEEARVIRDNRQLEMDGKLYASVSVLKAGDRIMLVEGMDGVRMIAPLEKQQRKVIRYIASSHSLQFTVVSLQEKNTFPLEGVHLHQQGAPISPTALKRDDAVDLYFHDGRLLEVEKR